MTKHYIRPDQNGTIIRAFSSDLEKPIQGDICVCENGERIIGKDKPYHDLLDADGYYKWAWDGQLVAANLDLQIDKIKADRLQKLDSSARNEILAAYPLSKQSNINNLGWNKSTDTDYLVADQDKMRQDINTIRNRLATLEGQVNAATTANQVKGIQW